MSGRRIKWLRKLYLHLGFDPQNRAEWRWFKKNWEEIIQTVVQKLKWG